MIDYFTLIMQPKEVSATAERIFINCHVKTADICRGTRAVLYLSPNMVDGSSYSAATRLSFNTGITCRVNRSSERSDSASVRSPNAKRHTR
jgi:hypothetical protein